MTRNWALLGLILLWLCCQHAGIFTHGNMCWHSGHQTLLHYGAFTKLSFHADASKKKYAGTLLNFILFVAAKSFYVCAVSEHGYRTVKPSSSLLKSWDQSPSSFGAVQFAYSTAWQDQLAMTYLSYEKNRLILIMGLTFWALYPLPSHHNSFSCLI